MHLLRKIKLKSLKGPCSLHGPSIASSKKYVFDVGENSLEIHFPKTNSNLPCEYRHPKNISSIGEDAVNPFSREITEWEGIFPVYQLWEYCGPMFTGELASLSFNLSIIRRANHNNNVSLFHPRAFEQTAGDFLTDLYGNDFTSTFTKDLKEVKYPVWITPRNWQTKQCGDVEGAFFQTSPRDGRCEEIFHAMAPLTPRFFLSLTFKSSWNTTLDESDNEIPESDTWIDRSPINELIHFITNSLKIDLSSSNLKARNAAITGLTDSKLIKSFPPLRFEENLSRLPEQNLPR